MFGSFNCTKFKNMKMKVDTNYFMELVLENPEIKSAIESDSFIGGTFQISWFKYVTDHNCDEIEFEADTISDLLELWNDFCIENNINPMCIKCVTYIGN